MLHWKGYTGVEVMAQQIVGESHLHIHAPSVASALHLCYYVHPSSQTLVLVAQQEQ